MATLAQSPVGAVAARPGHDFMVYEWCAWDFFLAQLLLPGAAHHRGAIADTAEDVLAQVSASCKSFLFQINLSLSNRFPLQRQALVDGLTARGVRVLNRGLADIRKSTLHRMLTAAGLPSAAAAREGPGDELLIVKTDYNYGGRYERILTPEERRRLGVATAEIGLAGWDDYRVLPRSAVPPEWWRDRTLIVESYIGNAEGEFFRVCVAGESVMVIKAYHEAMIKKVSGGGRDENFLIDRARLPTLRDNHYLPPQLLALIDRFLAVSGLDFGSLDIVHDGAQFYVVDLNTTPYGSREGLLDEVTEFLRRGLGCVA